LYALRETKGRILAAPGRMQGQKDLRIGPD
jgi:hypothetical protein